MTTVTIRRFGDSTFVKLSVLAMLILLMLIPVALVTSLVQERSHRQQQVQWEIAGVWGGAQTLLGPVLTVPYDTVEEHVTVTKQAGEIAPAASPATVERTQRTIRRHRHFLPADIAWNGELKPDIRYRGMFQVVVYEAHIEARGTLIRPAFDPHEGTPDWSEATLSLGVTDVRGLQQKITLAWQDSALGFLPGTSDIQALGGGIHAPLSALADAEPGEPLHFSFSLVLRGSGSLRFLPAGEETRVDLRSSWSDPGFTGAFLPTERAIEDPGFRASWNVPFFGRAFGQEWHGETIDQQMLTASTFGVDLVLPADAYQQTERSVKYAVLFILMTFGTFFLLELLSPARLHAVQYLLVGFALVLFYVLLLALSEHLGFGLSYILASSATSLLIGAYGRSILMNTRWAGLLILCLGGLYSYLYVLLRLEDLALLLGALGLFAGLAVVMRLTRNLDWHSLRFRTTESPESSAEPTPETTA